MTASLLEKLDLWKEMERQADATIPKVIEPEVADVTLRLETLVRRAQAQGRMQAFQLVANELTRADRAAYETGRLAGLMEERERCLRKVQKVGPRVLDLESLDAEDFLRIEQIFDEVEGEILKGEITGPSAPVGEKSQA